jgi:hypothetical protein
MRTMLAVLVVSILATGPAVAAPPAAPTLPAEVTAALGRPVCADPDLVARLVAAEALRQVLSRRYLGRHPRMQAQELRVTDLRRATASAPAAGPGACGGIAALLREAHDRARASQLRQAATLGAGHPEMTDLGLRLAFLGQCLARLSARGASAPGSPVSPGDAEARLAESEGRLRYLLAIYNDRHPRVVAARAQSEAARRALAASPLGTDPTACRARWAAFGLAIRRLLEMPAADPAERLQRDFALDRLVADRAKLRSVPGCP